MNETTTTPTPKTPSSKKVLLIITAIVLLCISIAASLFLGFLLGRNSIQTPEDNLLTVTPTQEVTLLPTKINTVDDFEYVTAEIPTGWSIVEYLDGTVPSGITDEELEYTGFGGLDIINQDGDNVFSIEMVYGGIGGSGECYEITKFKDTDPDYLASIEETNSNFFDDEDVVDVIDYTDLTTGNYKEYSLFDVVQMRFVKNNMYISLNYNGLYSGFNPACDQLKNVVELQSASSPNIMWEVTEGNSNYQGYTYKITNNATVTDMEGLDQVLSTLKAK